MGLFVRAGDSVTIRLEPAERRVVGLALEVLEGYVGAEDDPASSRLMYDAHPDDPRRSREFADLVAGELERQRAEDRSLFAGTLGADLIDLDEADAWLRVIGEARLVLGARLGITEDGWEDAAPYGLEGAQMALLRLLSAVQDDLVGALMGTDPIGGA